MDRAGAGGSIAADRAIESANKQVVLDMWHQVINGRDYAKAADYIARDYIQNSPSAGQGLDALVEFLKWELGEDGPLEPGSYEHTQFRHVIAEGDLVQLMFLRTMADPKDEAETISIWRYDTYRLKDGMIVEH